MEAEWTQEAVQRKQRVRKLTTDNRTLDERLKAARSNHRFQNRASPTSKPSLPNRH
ncbi:hypothetical protein [Streptomyces sp. NPDC040750]|uniref:hypothetical protein n=1 Tax=Streptomyces sp. NPDC040750 TaxID=3154491 RepID=UPI0033E9158E